MPGKQAKAVSPLMLTRMLHKACKSPFHARDRAMILLSVKAGLRACEIAKLEWSMVLDARGKVADVLAIHDAIAKKGGGRRIPTHPDLRRALQGLLRSSPPSGPVIRSAKGGHLRSTSVVNWFATLFRELGFEGCSSHSGRRTFITGAARNIHRSGCSLRDVQLLTGYRSIETTERYIDGDTRGQRRLRSMLFAEGSGQSFAARRWLRQRLCFKPSHQHSRATLVKRACFPCNRCKITRRQIAELEHEGGHLGSEYATIRAAKAVMFIGAPASSDRHR